MRFIHRRGFTLVELLVVIAIIGLLATVGVMSLNQARAKARDAKRVSEVQSIAKILELFVNAKGQYPAGTDVDMGGGCISEGKGVEAACTATAADVILLRPVPKSPNYDAGSADRYLYNSYQERDLSGSPTACTSNTTQNCQSYGIEFRLERSLSGISAGSHCYTSRGIFPAPETSAACP